MEIVHELNQLDFGGVEKVIRNIVKFDKKNNHSIIAYKDGSYRKHLEDAGARIILIEDDTREEVDISADVLHVHCGGAISHLAKDQGLYFPVVETIHSPVRSPNLSNRIRQRVGVTKAVSRMNDNAMTIYNGIDIRDMEPKRTRDEMLDNIGVDKSKPIIGRLGRLGRDKGLEEWMLTCYYLQSSGVDFTPVIIGPEARDDSGYRGILKLMCESLPLNGVVWIPEQSDIADYLQCVDVFLYPSPTEGFGLVFIEAMLSGAVVVSYDNDVNREVIGGYSALVDVKDGIPGLVNMVKKVLTNESFRGHLKSEQIPFVINEYSAERMSLEYQDVYEKCLVSRPEEATR